METAELTCERRNTRTKGDVRALRRNGQVPAVVYGPKCAAQAVTLTVGEVNVRMAASARQPVMKLKSSTPELNEKHVIFKNFQRSPISDQLLHLDLYEVDLTRRLQFSVPLRFIGRPKGVADGGILQPLEREVEVECFPLEIPEYVEVDVSALGIHDVLHVSALSFIGNVTPVFDSDFPVVTVLPPTIEEAPVAAVEAAGAEAETAAAGGAATGVAAEAQVPEKKSETGKK